MSHQRIKIALVLMLSAVALTAACTKRGDASRVQIYNITNNGCHSHTDAQALAYKSLDEEQEWVEFNYGNGVLTVKDVVTAIPVTHLRLVSDALVKLFHDLVNAVCIQFPLVGIAGDLQLSAFDSQLFVFLVVKLHHVSFLLGIVSNMLFLFQRVPVSDAGTPYRLLHHGVRSGRNPIGRSWCPVLQ